MKTRVDVVNVAYVFDIFTTRTMRKQKEHISVTQNRPVVPMFLQLESNDFRINLFKSFSPETRFLNRLSNFLLQSLVGRAGAGRF